MGDKRSKGPTPAKDSTHTTDGSISAGVNFMSEFLEFCKEFDIYPMPRFQVARTSVENPMSIRSMVSMGTLGGKFPNESLPVEQPETGEYIPVIYATYENPKKLDNLLKLQLKGFEVSVCMLDALGLAMQKYATITVLKLQNCAINAYGIVQVSQICTEVGSIRDLNLDMNPNTQENYHLLCNSSTKLLYLSLKLCGISDNGIERIAAELIYKNAPDTPTLVALNLANNDISEIGANFIGCMLRTNRSIQSLNLSGNRINDSGAISIIQQLSIGTTKDQRIQIDAMLREAQENQSDVPDDQKRPSALSQQRTSNRGSTASRRSKRKRSSQSGQRENIIRPKSMGGTSSQMTDAFEDLAESMLSPEQHPLTRDSVAMKDELMVPGNFTLQHLNLSFNQLTEETLGRIISCIQYQDYLLMNDVTKGLLYVPVEGNKFQEKNELMMRLNECLYLRHNKNEEFDTNEIHKLSLVDPILIQNKSK